MEYRIFLIIAPFSVGILLVTGVIIFRKRRNRLAGILLMYFIIVTGYLLANITELLMPSIKGTLNAAKMEHFFFSFLPIIWFRFALIYAGNQKLKETWKILFFCLIPVLTNIFVLTNSSHHLIWQNISYFTVHGYLTMKADYGPWMWIAGVYNDILYLFGIILILQSTFESIKIYQRQSFLIITGILFPIVFNALYAFHLLPFLHKDYTSISFAITAICSFIGITRFKLFQVSPVAKNRIMQDMSSPILVLDSLGLVVYFNKAAMDLLKLSDSCLGTIAGKNESLKLFLSAIDNKNGSWKSKGQIETENRIYNILSKPLTIQQKGPAGTLLTIIDVTTEVRLLREKTVLTEHLKKINKERQVTQAIIIQQEKMATIGQLTAEIAHEINNPLSFIKSNLHTLDHYGKQYAALCNQSRHSEESIQLSDLKKMRKQMTAILGDVEEGTNRVINIVQNLLNFSRPTRNQEEKLYDLNKGIETSLVMMGNQLKYTAQVEKHYGEIPKAECRESEINQTIINMISNAIYSMKSRKNSGEKNYSPLLSIRTWTDGKSIFCKISDNGVPIPQKNIPFLFDPFFTTKKNGDGTGLGLTIAREIIENRYGGSLTVEISDRNQFTFSFPVFNHKRSLSSNNYPFDSMNI